MDNNNSHRDIDSIKNQYHDFILEYTAQKVKYDKRSFLLSVFRFVSFIVALIVLYFAISKEVALFWVLGILLLLGFIVLMKIHSKLLEKRSYLKCLIVINENEILSLQGDNSKFDNGEKFEIDYHDYSLDLDIFGDQSIYQKVNRTNTTNGASVLASWFNVLLLNNNEIENRQKASQELSPLVNYRQSFGAQGMAVEEKNDEFEFLKEWKSQNNLFYKRGVFKILTILFPVINISVILLYSFDFIGGRYLALSLIATLLFVGFFQKKIHKIHQNLSKRSKLLEKYVALFQQIENHSFNAELLKNLQSKLNSGGKKSSLAINELSQILSALDSRLNVIMGIILNAIFIWDIRQVYRMEQWKDTYSVDFEQWFETIGEFDALMSLSNLQYNNPKWTLPIIKDKNEWHMEDIRHPLMLQNECVENNFVVSAMPFIKVITGANMAGKSTYLRSVGSNLVLAMMGAVVNAKSMCFHPIQIVSSLRTSDSLMSGESYFYAEIKRLQMIVERLRNGEKIFVLLDEILKGTNSNDKEQGSRSLLEQLIKLNTIGVIATHDLSLGNLSSIYPNTIQNMCFEVDIINDQLSFDYKMRDGVAQNMNASFLLKKMGIVES